MSKNTKENSSKKEEKATAEEQEGATQTTEQTTEPAATEDQDAPASEEKATAEEQEGAESEDAEEIDEGDFLGRQAALNAKLADLASDYASLMGDIESDGTHFTGFRKVKETFFRLQALTLRNGGSRSRKERAAGQNHAIFQKKEPQESAQRQAKTATKPAPDLFNRNRRVDADTEERPVDRRNPPPTDLFKKPAPKPATPIRKAPKPPEPDNKRKVLATSEDKVKKGDD